MFPKYSTNTLVRAIHDSPLMASIIITGGGSEVIPMLLTPGGGSKTLINHMVPYQIRALTRLIGGKVDKIVSEETARMLSMRAFKDAIELCEFDVPMVGVATTSALQRTPDERSDRTHHIYVAGHTDIAAHSVSLKVPVNRHASAEAIRGFEEHLNAVMVLNMLAKLAGISEIPLGSGFDEGCVKKSSTLGDRWPDQIRGLMLGFAKAVCFACSASGINLINHDPAPFILPGAFHPVHEGHIAMSKAVAGPCDFELSIKNMDKPMLDLLSLEERLKAFCDIAQAGETFNVWVTTRPSFIEKATLFPNTTFVVGYDTIKRLSDPGYGTPMNVIDHIFEEQNTSFNVCGRKQGDEFVCTLDGIDPRIRKFCTVVDRFRNDTSSTAIRAAKRPDVVDMVFRLVKDGVVDDAT